MYTSLQLALSTLFLISPNVLQNTDLTANLEPHCSHVQPITREEFTVRQGRLVDALASLGASAYITEPSANSQFFANFSSSNWKLSERPLLLIITPHHDPQLGNVQPRITMLTPKFETLRAKSLPIASFNKTQIQYIEWAEEVDPYGAALSGIGISPTSGTTIFVDSHIRKFLVDGLQQAAPRVRFASAPIEITQLRERKSAAELDILKCANEATLLAIRDVHKRMYIGMRESQAQAMVVDALTAVGLKNGGCLTLFGANAALPHGSGTDRFLSSSDFILFDCTASLHGYYSDVTRTIALPGTRIPDAHIRIWYAVHEAQIFALRAAKSGALTSAPDEAARSLLKVLGLDQFFTHRLGHGIGIEVHEQPYLRGGSEDMIQTGHTFSNEPGVYIQGEVGVRLEDCFFLDKNGKGVFLTEGVGGQSVSPWSP